MADPKGISTSLIAGHTIIIDPMNTHVVAKVIHMGSLDVGTLCSDNNKGNRGYVNKWAKYKPVIRKNRLDTTDELVGGTGTDKNRWKDGATWWKGDDGKCGLTVNKYSRASEMRAGWDDNWKYNPPTGGLAAPYRLIDFNYYDHNAVKFANVWANSMERDGNGNALHFAGNGITLGIQMGIFYSDYSLKIMDFQTALFTDFVNFYFGVVVVNNPSSNSREYTVKVNTTPFGKSDLQNGNASDYTRLIELDGNHLPNTTGGTVSMIYPVLVPNTYSQIHGQATGTSDFSGTLVPLPVSPIEVRAGSVLSNLSRYWASYTCGKHTSSGAVAGFEPAFDFVLQNSWQYTEVRISGSARFYMLDGKNVTSYDGSASYLSTNQGNFRIIELYSYSNNYIEKALNASISHGSSYTISFSTFTTVGFVNEKDGVLDSYPDGVRFGIELPNNLGTYASDPIYL